MSEFEIFMSAKIPQSTFIDGTFKQASIATVVAKLRTLTRKYPYTYSATTQDLFGTLTISFRSIKAEPELILEISKLFASLATEPKQSRRDDEQG